MSSGKKRECQCSTPHRHISATSFPAMLSWLEMSHCRASTGRAGGWQTSLDLSVWEGQEQHKVVPEM